MMVAGLQQGGNPRVVLRTADSFMKAVNRPATRLRLGVMPLDTLKRVYLKSSWTGRVYLLSGWTHWHWQLEEKDGEDPSSAVVTLRPEFVPLQRSDHGLP